MLLRYLEAENFLSHEHEQIALPEEGIFLLSGESGAGKSSLIIDAVAYALFGPVATRAKRQQELRHIAHPDEPMHVRATFDFPDGRRLTLARGIDARGSSWAQAYEPDPDDPRQSVLLAEGAAPVGRLVRRELGGMTWSQFYAAFVARQSEITLLTTKRGAERKDLVQKMLGMRELEKGAELISERLRRANAEREQLERSLGEVDLVAEERRLGEARQRQEEAEQRVGELERKLAARRREAMQAEAELEPLRERQRLWQQAERLEAEARVHEAALQSLREKLKRSERAAELVADVDKLREQARSAEAERDRLREVFKRSAEHGKLSAKRAAAAERRAEARAELLALQPVVVGAAGAEEERAPTATEITTEIGVAEAKLEALDAQIAEQRSQLERLREDGECFACQRPFHSEEDHARVIAGLEQAFAERQEERAEFAAKLQALSEQLPKAKALDEAERAVTEVEARLQELEAEGEINPDLEAVKAAGKAAASQLEAANRELAVAESARADLDPQIADKVKDAEAKLSELRAAKPQVEALPADELEKAEKRLSDLKGQAERLAGQLPEAKGLVAEAKQTADQAEKSLEGRRLELENLEKLRSRALELEKLQSYLKAYQKHLAQEIRPSLEEIGSEMLLRISNGKHVAMHIGDDYEIEVEIAGGERIKAAMLSGGEEIRANICLRLALTRLVSQRTGIPVGFLMLDEPLPAQDPGHIERIMELLESLRPFYRQQFVISHVGDLRASDQVDYVIEFGGEGRDQVALVAA